MARIDRRVSPNQTALWTLYELHRCRRSIGPFAATSQQHAPVNNGQSRHCAVTLRCRSERFRWSARLTSKLVMRVRFPSPAPTTKAQVTARPPCTWAFV
jgi:hypothetical protein